MDERVMAKLAKLLELKERGTEHEAEVAAERAAELMAKHQISMFDLANFKMGDIGEPEVGRIDDVDGDDIPSSARFEAWRGTLAEVLARSQGARSYRIGNKFYTLWVIGPPGSRDAVRYMYMALSRTIATMGRRAQRTNLESNAWRRAYCRGVVARISARLKETRERVVAQAPGTALVVLNHWETKVQAKYDGMGMRDSRCGSQKRPDGMAQGWEDGAHVDLDGNRPALGEAKKRLRS